MTLLRHSLRRLLMPGTVQGAPALHPSELRLTTEVDGSRLTDGNAICSTTTPLHGRRARGRIEALGRDLLGPCRVAPLEIMSRGDLR